MTLSDDINALPQHLRDYIHDLETQVDPAGTIQELHAPRENVAALTSGHWTKTWPTAPGFYFMRVDFWKPENTAIVRVVQYESGLHFHYGQHGQPPPENAMWWSEPIRVPDPPTEKI